MRFKNPFVSRHKRLVEHLLAEHTVKLDTLLHQGTILMANIDDIVTDAAALKVGNKALIQLMGNALAEITTIKGQPNVDPATQAKLDQLHADLTSDLNDVTATLTADSTSIDVPAPAPVPNTGGATGN